MPQAACMHYSCHNDGAQGAPQLVLEVQQTQPRHCHGRPAPQKRWQAGLLVWLYHQLRCLPPAPRHLLRAPEGSDAAQALELLYDVAAAVKPIMARRGMHVWELAEGTFTDLFGKTCLIVGQWYIC